MAKKRQRERDSATGVFALPTGPVDLARMTTDVPKFGPQDKKAASAEMARIGVRLADLQEKLYAQGVTGSRARVLLILQGMDTSGKDGVISHVVGMVNPAGIRLTSFKKPTAEELSHDFLWRIQNALPPPGYVGVFNRSQYEDVLVVRVHNLVPRRTWMARYRKINQFETRLAGTDTVIVKCFLHISRKEQQQRLAARLEDPTKYWKYNPADLAERARWDDYQQAYADALEKCHSPAAPWSVVPSDHKWYRNWAVAALVLEALERLDPVYPPPDFDVEAEKAKVAAS